MTPIPELNRILVKTDTINEKIKFYYNLGQFLKFVTFHSQKDFWKINTKGNKSIRFKNQC